MRIPLGEAARRAARWVRYNLVIAILAAVLTLVGLVAGCDPAEEPIPLYGPPPDGTGTDGAALDTAPPLDVTGQEDTVPLYGPPPLDVIEDQVPADLVDVAQPPPPYGPIPVDTIEDVSAELVDVAQPPPPYGPIPVDTIEDVSAELVDVPQPPPPYGPMPVDTIGDLPAAEDCPPVAVYGPPPCDSDEDCVQWFGQGWYCDKDNTFPDGCGGTISWPACVQK